MIQEPGILFLISIYPRTVLPRKVGSRLCLISIGSPSGPSAHWGGDKEWVSMGLYLGEAASRPSNCLIEGCRTLRG